MLKSIEPENHWLGYRTCQPDLDTVWTMDHGERTVDWTDRVQMISQISDQCISYSSLSGPVLARQDIKTPGGCGGPGQFISIFRLRTGRWSGLVRLPVLSRSPPTPALPPYKCLLKIVDILHFFIIWVLYQQVNIMFCLNVLLESRCQELH